MPLSIYMMCTSKATCAAHGIASKQHSATQDRQALDGCELQGAIKSNLVHRIAHFQLQYRNHNSNSESSSTAADSRYSALNQIHNSTSSATIRYLRHYSYLS